MKGFSTNRSFAEKSSISPSFVHHIHKIVALTFLESNQVISGFE